MNQPTAERPEELSDYAESIVETVRTPLLVLDERLRVRMANRAFYQTFRVMRDLGKYWFEIVELPAEGTGG